MYHFVFIVFVKEKKAFSYNRQCMHVHRHSNFNNVLCPKNILSSFTRLDEKPFAGHPPGVVFSPKNASFSLGGNGGEEASGVLSTENGIFNRKKRRKKSQPFLVHLSACLLKKNIKKSTFESLENLTVRAAILCQAVCINDVINKAKCVAEASNTSRANLFCSLQR